MKRIGLIVIIALLVVLIVVLCIDKPATQPDNNDVTNNENVETDPGTNEDPVEELTLNLSDDGTVAVWWWHKDDAAPQYRETYLSFLEKNSVNEIYIDWHNFEKEELASFVIDAGKHGMKVSFLAGEAEWVLPDNNDFDDVLDAYLEYQAWASPEARLSSLHLDIEPHQLRTFNDDKDLHIQYFADFVVDVTNKIRAANDRIEWDVTFWYDEYDVTNEYGVTENFVRLLARNSDALCIMSYRDSVAGMLDCASYEIEVCKEYNRKIILGLETKSDEGDKVSFMEEGRREMYGVCETVFDDLARQFGTGNYGVAIHHLNTWYRLADDYINGR